jgi:energy-coupling factor transporter ATP-binding protein EcfA2
MSRLELPQLPESFWDGDVTLRNIRNHAWSADNPCASDALLGCLLARVATATHHQALVNGSSLNYFVAIVGASGAGKTTANKYAGELLPNIGTKLDGRPVGSGEGLIEAYLGRGDDGKEKKQIDTAALFYVDEGETFIRGTKRDASTTLGTIRSAWSGTVLGQQNASKDTTRLLPAGSYRMALIMGFQPEYIAELINDDAAGTPQRFLLVSSIDKRIPDVAEKWRGSLDIRKAGSGAMHVDSEILRIIRGTQVRIRRGEIARDRQDTHIDLMQLRTAALLSLLCGSNEGITIQWWNLAGLMTENSRKIIDALQDEYRRVDIDKRTASVEQRIQTSQMIDEDRLKRIALNLGKKAHKHGANTFGNLTRYLAARDRTYADLDDAVERGYLVRIEDTNHYGAGRMVDKT